MEDTIPEEVRDVDSKIEVAPDIAQLYDEKYVTPRSKPFTTPIKRTQVRNDEDEEGRK